MARQASVEADARDVAHGWPILPEVIGHIAHPQIRNRGTVGGSLAHNDPAAELPAVMLALDAEMIAHGPQGRAYHRGVRDFFAGTMDDGAGTEDELLTEIRIPGLPEGTGWGFQEAARRQGDFALVAVVVLLRPAGAGQIDARVVVNGTGDGPSRMPEAEALLAERGADGGCVRGRAGNAAAEACDAADDPHAPAWYRQKLVAALTRRACREALIRMGR